MRALLLCTFLAVAPGFASATTITSDFQVDTDGWTHTGASVFQQLVAGPNGFLYIDNSEGPITYIFAPAKFLGDLSAFDGGTVSFDGNQLSITAPPWTSAGEDYGHLTISGPGGSATLDLLPAPGQPTATWTTYSATLSAAAFGKTQQEWDAILADVTSIRLSVEAVFGGEVEGIDNFTLRSVPEPSFLALATVAAGALAAARQRKRR
ncbi:MAG: hypothetical protein FJ091_13290 [Deltaproteobacteria bacterium]|nr:hypothetical protein [Deltaproteobacteria bacterium]